MLTGRVVAGPAGPVPPGPLAGPDAAIRPAPRPPPADEPLRGGTPRGRPGGWIRHVAGPPLDGPLAVTVAAWLWARRPGRSTFPCQPLPSGAGGPGRRSRPWSAPSGAGTPSCRGPSRWLW